MVANFATSSPCVVDISGKFANGVNNTGGKLPPVSTTPAAICQRCQRYRRQICRRCQQYRRQIANGINDTGGKFATGVIDTGGKGDQIKLFKFF